MDLESVNQDDVYSVGYSLWAIATTKEYRESDNSAFISAAQRIIARYFDSFSFGESIKLLQAVDQLVDSEFDISKHLWDKISRQVDQNIEDIDGDGLYTYLRLSLRRSDFQVPITVARKLLQLAENNFESLNFRIVLYSFVVIGRHKLVTKKNNQRFIFRCADLVTKAVSAPGFVVRDPTVVRIFYNIM